MTSYTNMKLHLDRHVYKRGMFEGDAPVESRAKNHFRVVQAPSYRDEMYVRFHNTNIITAYPDGSVMLNCNGWANSVTTKVAMREAAWRFCRFIISIGSKTVMSQKQDVVTIRGKTYVYYDGMKFDVDGKLLSEAKPFKMRRIDKEQTKQHAIDIKESGFKDMFPVLYSTCTVEQSREWLRSDFCIPLGDREASKWPVLIAKYKYHGWSGVGVKDMKATWASIMKDAKAGMYNVSDSSITAL